MQENLFLCYNLFRRERKGYLYVCVGDREVWGGGVYPEEIQISQSKCECENTVFVFYLIFM